MFWSSSYLKALPQAMPDSYLIGPNKEITQLIWTFGRKLTELASVNTSHII